MNRAITGAWATGSVSSSGGGRRTNKISLNAPPVVVASAIPSNSAAASSSSSSSSPWLVPDNLPPGSAAAAAAFREANPTTVNEENATSGRQDAPPFDVEQIEDGLSDEQTTRTLAKRKTRNVSSSTNVLDTSNTTPSKTKRRRAANAGAATSKPTSSNIVVPTARLRDLGGVTNALDKVLELIAMPLCHPEVYAHTGVKPPRGVLLHGPPGCGKTMLAGALAGELNVPFFSISSPSIVSGTSGESEQTLRKLFDDAIAAAPCILFLDEIDAITPKRETASREMERRIVAQLLTLLDDLSWDKTQGKPVMIIGATNRPDAIDPALRRAGRFDHEIALGVPDEAGREEILRILCADLRLSGDFDLRSLAKQTPGFVGADLVALTAAAGIRSVKRIFNQLAQQGRDIDMIEGDESGSGSGGGGGGEVNAGDDGVRDDEEADSERIHAVASASLFDALPVSLQHSAIATFLRTHPTPLSSAQLQRLHITPDDFFSALPSIQPSSKREGFATVPEVTWSDIGALEATREELEMTIVEPIKRPELFQAIGVSSSGGVLLWGPPGCGKTLLAKAVANESGANFISVKGPELLNKYVGESERAVRQVFARARTSSPCVIFFDELDALVPRRDDALSESSSRVVNTLLTELDGMEARNQTYVIGATNRPDMIDPAMCRPGRLDKLLYVDLPNTLERIKILRTLTKKTPLKHVDDPSSVEAFDDAIVGVQREVDHARQEGLAWLCRVAVDARCDGFSGADIAALVREASVMALRETLRMHRDRGEHSTTTTTTTNDVVVQVDAEHFSAALDKVQPSVGVAQRRKYEHLRSRLSGLPGASNATSSSRRDAEREHV